MPQPPKLVNRGATGLLNKVSNADVSVLPSLPVVKVVKDKIADGLKALAVPISSLKFDPRNAREHNERNLQAIKDSLCLFGQVKPVVVRKQTRVVMAGNGTMQAATELGWTKIAAVIVPMSDLDAAGYGVADNRTAELATWNLDVMKEITRMQHESGCACPGWSAAEIMAIRMEEVATETDVDKVPEAPEEPVTRKGDLWALGKHHRLLCGDSSDPKAIKRLMNGKKAILMATDPPYGVAFGEKNYCPTAKDWGAIQGDKREGDELRQWLSNVIKTWLPHMVGEAAYYFWSAQLSEGHRFYEAIVDAGLHVQSQIIWAKNRFALGQADYQWRHEPAWYAFQKGAKHRWLAGRDKTTVWDVSKVANSEYLHPTQKPVDLFRLPIEYHTHAGEVVAEPFCGSGSQIIAAENTGRACYGMELDEKFCDVALQRFFNLTGVSPIRHDGKTFKQLAKSRG